MVRGAAGGGARLRPRNDAPRVCRFWVFLRWKEDGSTLIFGHAPHFQHELDHEEEHSSAHSPRYKPHAPGKH